MTYEEKFALAERSGEDGAFARIDETHPVGIFLGIEGGQRAVMILCPRRPPEPPNLAAIRVEAGSRQDGQWALVMRLVRPDLKALFTRLVEDLDGATRQRDADPGTVVMSRLARWQRLLSRRPSELLDDQEIRGLAAELDFLLSEAIPAVGAGPAAGAWVGPFGCPKDFVFDRAEVEVKAAHRQRDEITISSLEQLSDAGLPIYLWTKIVELGAVGGAGGDSLSALVGRVRTAVSHDTSAAERVEDGLRSAGYQDRPEYGSRPIHLGKATTYHVAGKFPRLQRAGVPSGVVACTYDIAEPDLDAFRVATWREALVDGR